MKRDYGHYRILERLSTGGLVDVFRAVDDRIDRIVEFKLLASDALDDPEIRRRFVHEAEVISALEHPHIVDVRDVGTFGSRYYMASEFIEGETLRERIKREPLKPQEIVVIAIQVASALEAAHEVGLIHRDLRPENIKLSSNGMVKIADFGIASLRDESERSRDLTVAGSSGGTILYYSPEQLRGQSVDPRTDIWSLGVVLFEMATQRSPFAREHVGKTLHSILEAQPLPPVAEVSPPFNGIIAKALQKDPAHRYKSATEFTRDLMLVESKFSLGDKSEGFSIPYNEQYGESFFQKARPQDEPVDPPPADNDPPVGGGGGLQPTPSAPEPGEPAPESAAAGDEETTRGAQEVPAVSERETTSGELYINLWIEDEYSETLPSPAVLTCDAPYTFNFAIENSSRDEGGVSKPFEEPEELKETPVTSVVIELLCPFLITDDQTGYVRRGVDYHAGIGFPIEKFALKPTLPGRFFLTARLLINGETLYREVLLLEVLNQASVATAEIADIASDHLPEASR
jgi:serine/threonine protein kinase